MIETKTYIEDAEEFIEDSVPCPERGGSGDGQQLDVDLFEICFFCRRAGEIDIIIPFDEPPVPQPLWAPEEMPMRKPPVREIPSEEKAA